MNDTQRITLSELIERLHETMLASGSGAVDGETLHELERASRRLAKQARTDGAGDAARALEKMARALAGVKKDEEGVVDYAAEILPALYALEEHLPDEHSDGIEDRGEEAAESATESLRLDLRPDYERLMRLDSVERRLLEAGVREGRRPMLVRVDGCGNEIVSVREQLERSVAVVRLIEERRFDRVLAIVVDPINPDLEKELSAIVDEARLSIQEIDLDSLRDYDSIAGEWYRRLPPIRFETLQSSMETLQFYLEQVVRRSTDPFLDEFATLLGEAFTVGMREIIDSVRPGLEEIAEGSGRRVDIELVGEVDRIGVEMGESLREALVELIANAIIHGIEPPEERLSAGKGDRGRIQIRAAREETSRLRIDVVDDGRGLDETLLKETMRDTSRRSGLFRVRRSVTRRFGGKVVVRSGAHGTTISMRLPALRGTFYATVFGDRSRRYCLPSSMVTTTMAVTGAQVSHDITGGTFLGLGGRTVPYMVFDESGGLDFVEHAPDGWALLIRICGRWIALHSAVEPENGAAVPAPDGTYTVPMLDLSGVQLPLLPDSVCR